MYYAVVDCLIKIDIDVGPGDRPGFQTVKRIRDKPDMHPGKRKGGQQRRHPLSRGLVKIPFLESIDPLERLGHSAEAVKQVQCPWTTRILNRPGSQQSGPSPKNAAFQDAPVEMHRLPQCLAQNVAAIAGYQGVIPHWLIDLLKFGQALPRGKQRLVKPDVWHRDTMCPQPGAQAKKPSRRQQSPNRLMWRLKLQRNQPPQQSPPRTGRR